MGVSKNNGTPKSSILIGFSIINHPFLGTATFGNIHMYHLYGDSTSNTLAFVTINDIIHHFGWFPLSFSCVG